MDFYLESCCTSLSELLFAQDHGASRIELCEDLPVGGVTPSHALIQAAVSASRIPVNVLVRARGGDFVFSPEEVEQMVADIRFCRESGANAVVIGALDKDGNVDVAAMKKMIAAAREGEGKPLHVTFHRAFDVCADPITAFEQIISLGCDTLLTSGHEATAPQGADLIARLVKMAEGRIVVLAGSGVRNSNIAQLAERTGAPQFHASASFFSE